MNHWNVWGTFIIPGTRDKLYLPRTRVIAKDRQQASKDVAGFLQEKFRDSLPRDRGSRFSTYKFSAQFAMMHLQWQEEHMVPIQEEEVVSGVLDTSNRYPTMIEGLFSNPFEEEQEQLSA